MNQTVDILCRARALYASAPSHAPVNRHPEPGTYCVVTAVSDVVSDWTPVTELLWVAMGRPILGTVEWNAGHSTEEVLAAFDRAILAEGLRVPDLQPVELAGLAGTERES